MKKPFTIRLEDETIKELSDIVNYEKEINFLDLTSTDIARAAIIKYIKEYNVEGKRSK